MKPWMLWRLRSWWHRPEMHREGTKPETFVYWDSYDRSWQFRPEYALAWHYRQYGRIPRIAFRHAAGAATRVYWWLRWHSGLGCAGGAPQPITGHLRTRVCDWLEARARAEERPPAERT